MPKKGTDGLFYNQPHPPWPWPAHLLYLEICFSLNLFTKLVGGPSVTAYREARRFATQDMADDILAKIGDTKLKALIHAADTGNWQEFVELSGGPSVSRKDQPLRAFHVKKEGLNKYGEATKKILGLILGETKKLITRIRTWNVRPIAPERVSKYFDPFFSSGGAHAPPLEFCQ